MLTTGNHEPASCPAPIPFADLIVKPGATIVFGEIHGTNEIPAAFGAIACHAGEHAPLIVGLEIMRDEQARIDRFLASDGGSTSRADLLAGVNWSFRDGRSSVAMLELIDHLRTWHVPIVAFDVGEGEFTTNEREQAMTEPLLAARSAHPDAAMIILTGSLHARLAENDAQLDVQWMAMRLRRSVPRLMSFNASYGRGTAWVCMDDSCGVHTVGAGDDPGPTRITRDSEWNGAEEMIYQGHLHVGAVTASHPAN